MLLDRIKGYVAITIVYVAAFMLGFFVFNYLPFNNEDLNLLVLKFFIADVVATVFIYLVGSIFKNPSFYDPYWSVGNFVILLLFYLMVNRTNPFATWFVIIAGVWAVRLTINWAIFFNNIKHCDWRYTMFKEKHPKIFWFINLFGIHLMPTLLTFIGLIPGFCFIAEVGNSFQPSLVTIIGLLLMLFAIIIETIADVEMILFKKHPYNAGLVNDKGLWKNSRHPNYFGEVLFWVSMFLTYYSFDGAIVALVFCPLFIFLLFEFISIPMMDKRQLNSKPAYKEYKEHTNAMLPIFPPKRDK